jgi:tRNA pseudouridine55 synthase
MNEPLRHMGVINIYKEKDYTSHDVVAVVRKTLGGVKAGHTGTLDPQAEGVLPVCVGRATKFAGLLTQIGDKSYTAEVLLGTTTNTGDGTGTAIRTRPVVFDNAAIDWAARLFVGVYGQVPPMYSAIKVKGQKLYELARQGVTVEREARPVRIDRIEIIKYEPERNAFFMEVDCAKGTYIRSLCADIGDKLGCGAYMGTLIRTRSGIFTAEKAVRLAEFKQAAAEGLASKYIMGIEEALPHPRAYLLPEGVRRAENGNPVPFDCVTGAGVSGGMVWLHDDMRLIGLYKWGNNALKPEVMCL